jgi:predicted neutral ceramidase superfamily lipid hydrolase
MKYIYFELATELVIHIITWCLFFTITHLTEKAFGIVGVFYLVVMVLPIVVLFVLNKFSRFSEVNVLSYTYVVSHIFIAPVIVSLLFAVNIIPLFVIGLTLGTLSFLLSRIAIYSFMKKTGNNYVCNCHCNEEEEECDCEHCHCDCTGCEDCNKKESTVGSTECEDCDKEKPTIECTDKKSDDPSKEDK